MEPATANAAVFTVVPVDLSTYTPVKGYEIGDDGVNWEAMFNSFKTTGFQATNLALAIEKINEMLRWRLSDDPVTPETDEEWRDPELRAQTKAKIFLGFTSNMISSGIREYILFLCKHKLIDVLVTTAGGIEEDFIKCMAPTFMGDFHLAGSDLRKKGLNRIGNLLIPNNNYCVFETWVMPILDAMLAEQKATAASKEPQIWSPSKMIHRLGREIDNPNSVFYWCAKNDIPVFCPAITDGSLGDMVYFHSFRNPGLIVDIAQDIRALNNQTVFEKKTGMIIIGGGVVKHHICNANLMRNGADWSVFINTGNEFDGSDSGARPDEAVSWGKIRLGVEGVKVYAEATLVFPIIVAMTFAKYLKERDAKEREKKLTSK